MSHGRPPADYFPPDYVAARDRFRAAADRLGWGRHTLPIDARGPAGEELTVDVALSAPAGGEPLVVLSSGVHGVEGYFGSAVQLAVFDELARGGPPTAVRWAVIHAVNPFGFAHTRRMDETNTDPNRNYLAAGETYTGAPPLYAAVDPVLNPRRPPSRWEPFTLKAAWFIARHGLPALKQAIAGGQYEYPEGMFFGGRGPSQTQLLLRDRWPGWLADAPAVVHLDFHTGLGAWGTYKLLIDPPYTAAEFDGAGRWFGPGVVEASAADGVAYQTRGAFVRWCADQAGGRPYLPLCAEFGTYGSVKVLGAVRAENQAHHWGRPADPGTARAKSRLREMFGPADAGWRATVLASAARLVRQAAAGVAGGPAGGAPPGK